MMMTEVNFTSMTLSQLVNFYNEHCDKPVKKFRDRATAERRCVELMCTTLKEPKLETAEQPEPVGKERPLMKTSLKIDRQIIRIDSEQVWKNAHTMWVENPDWMTSSQQDRLTAQLYKAAKRGEQIIVAVNDIRFRLLNVAEV
jgi:hypothetical protein